MRWFFAILFFALQASAQDIEAPEALVGKYQFQEVVSDYVKTIIDVDSQDYPQMEHLQEHGFTCMQGDSKISCFITVEQGTLPGKLRFEVEDRFEKKWFEAGAPVREAELIQDMSYFKVWKRDQLTRTGENQVFEEMQYTWRQGDISVRFDLFEESFEVEGDRLYQTVLETRADGSSTRQYSMKVYFKKSVPVKN